jgi:hypothetical protein
MVKLIHLNDRRPSDGDTVLVSNGRGSLTFMVYTHRDDTNLDEDDDSYGLGGGRNHVWYDESDDCYEDLDSYPYWTPNDIELENKSGNNAVVDGGNGSVSNADYTIPGYKIVGGVVIKA